MFCCCFVITYYAAKRAREVKQNERTDRVVSLAEECHDVLALFFCEHLQYFVFPKEEKDEKALLSGVVC